MIQYAICSVCSVILTFCPGHRRCFPLLSPLPLLLLLLLPPPPLPLFC